MDFGKLNDSQKAIARMIAETARANNVDPELALAIGFAESNFINQNNRESGAMGIMQVMPANAKGLGIEVEDLADPSKNIDAGIRILKENLDRYKGDAKLAAIAYNSRPIVADRYAKIQDDAILPTETQAYLPKINSFRDLSQPGYLAPVEASDDEEPIDMGGLPEPIDKPIDKSTLNDMYLSARMAASGPSGEIDKTFLTGAGATLGGIAGTYEAGSRAGSKIMKALSSTKEAAEAAKAAHEASIAASKSASPDSAGQKWKAKTGYGLGSGDSVQNVSSKYERAKGKGKITGRMSKLYGVADVGEPTALLDRMIYQKELQERTAKQAAELAAAEQKAAIAAAKKAKTVSRVGALARIPIIGPTIAGGSMGYDIADAIERGEQGDYSGAAIKGIGALGSGMALVPHPLTRAVGTGLGLASIPAGMLNDYLKRK
jgi:hypothetical protein